MQDDFESAAWAAHHGRVSAAIHKFVGDIMTGFARLNAIQFDAPWQRETKKRECR